MLQIQYWKLIDCSEITKSGNFWQPEVAFSATFDGSKSLGSGGKMPILASFYCAFISNSKVTKTESFQNWQLLFCFEQPQQMVLQSYQIWYCGLRDRCHMIFLQRH